MFMGEAQPVHVTPSQRAKRLNELLPEAKEAIAILETEHTNELFTTQPGDPVQARRAAIGILYKSVRSRVLRFLGYNYPEFDEHPIRSSRNGPNP